MQDHDAAVLWRALYGSQRGLIGVHSALRPAPGSSRLYRHRSRFFDYPDRANAATARCLRNSQEGLEAYFCAHLLLARRRVKANAAPVLALWADADGSPLPPDAPEPTAVVESSPGRAHLFWRLTRPVPPTRAENLNRRLLVAVGADRSGWDLSQLLRPPGTRNRKYEDAPTVKLLELDQGLRYHPRELELALPPGSASGSTIIPSASGAAVRPSPANRLVGQQVDLSRLSGRMRNLIALGNTAAGKPYPTRSHADFAVAIAMFGSGFEEQEVWAVMTDPANGISERYRDRGCHGPDYLARTIGKARDRALPYPASSAAPPPPGPADTGSPAGLRPRALAKPWARQRPTRRRDSPRSGSSRDAIGPLSSRKSKFFSVIRSVADNLIQEVEVPPDPVRSSRTLQSSCGYRPPLAAALSARTLSRASFLPL